MGCSRQELPPQRPIGADISSRHSGWYGHHRCDFIFLFDRLRVALQSVLLFLRVFSFHDTGLVVVTEAYRVIDMTWPNKAASPNRRPPFPLGGPSWFIYRFCARPASPAAVGEPQR